MIVRELPLRSVDGMSKIKQLYKKYEEIVKYLIFGVLTTLVGWIVYFSLLWMLKAVVGVAPDDNTSAKYIAIYTVAQVVQWIAAVLFAFFTNRKWVFTNAKKDIPVGTQLIKFAAGRVVTFFIDYLVTLFASMGIAALISGSTALVLFGRAWNMAEISAKIIAAVIVIICNYIFSKIFVFKDKK